MHKGIFIGKIKGNPNLMMTVLEYDLIGELSYRTRIKSPLIMNLSFLHFWIVTKLLEEKTKKKRKENIDELIDNLSNKVLSNHNERYVDWSFLEKVELDQKKKVIGIFIAFYLSKEKNNNKDLEDIIEVDNNNKKKVIQVKFTREKDNDNYLIICDQNQGKYLFNSKKGNNNKENNKLSDLLEQDNYKEILKLTLLENYENIKNVLDPLIDFWS